MGTIAIRLKISGRVHGVSFRASMAHAATGHGVRGWVRNLPDGTVEAVLEGEERDVRRLVEWAKHGPPRAEVEGVQMNEVPLVHHHGFRIEP